MDTLVSVLTYSLLFSWLKAVSLYVMGSLGLRVLVDVVEAVQQGKLMLELSLSESLGLLPGSLVGDDSVDVEQGLVALGTSSMWDVGGAVPGPEDNLSCMGTLGDGLGLLRVDKWWSNGSTVGEALAGWGNWGIGM